ncbi:MAG: hypothetical protein PVJ57_16165 [Phycisphaerae bacterium]|jgi:hypothetical protein
MVKAMVVILLVAGLIVAGIYLFGGTRSFDPDKQGRQARAAIQPGMSWEQVVKICEPKNFRIVQATKQKTFNGETVIKKPGVPQRYDHALLAGEVDARRMEHGFVFDYNFSHQVAFEVWFDAAGEVTEVNDLATMADLLDTRGGG